MKIQIKCPECGAFLTIEDSPNNAGKKVKCPVCKTVNVYEKFRRPGSADHAEKGKEEDSTTSVVQNRVSAVLVLVDQDTGIRYKLREGRNTVGRMTHQSASKADVAITKGEGCEDMGFSREHMIIEVKAMKDGFLHAFISNYKNKNRTCVNGEELAEGDVLGLNNGDIIKSSATVLRFEVQQAESETANGGDKTEL